MTVEHRDDPSVSATALAVLRETFGYPAFRGQQAEIIDACRRRAAMRWC